MNEHQLLCFLTVSRTLNFSAAARELYCTQPALSYQIRSLEKGAGRRTVPPHDDAGGPHRGRPRPAAPCGKHLPRHPQRPHGAERLRHPPHPDPPPAAGFLQRDPIYPILMARLHAALPGYEFKVDTTPVPPATTTCSAPRQTRRSTFPSARCRQRYAVRPSSATGFTSSAPEHPFSGQSSVELSDLAGQQIFYEPPLSGYGGFRPEAAGDALFHTGLADGGKLRVGLRRASGRAGMFLCPMIYPAFPAGWHIPLHLSIPDTRLLTLRDDPRPEICTLRKVFAEVYAEREKLIKAL